MNPGLSGDSVAIFDAFATENFEAVLRNLYSSVTVLGAIGAATARVDALRAEVRDGLIAAVHDIHVPFADFEPLRTGFRAALAGREAVFTLNYDLLVYWAIMSEPGGDGFVDAFWGRDLTFDRSDTEIRGKTTPVYHLHGGLHLERLPDGTAKKRSAAGAGLLASFGQPVQSGSTPLFVSEGTGHEKLRSILSSDYLTWCLESLEELEGPLEIFGVGFGPEDDHIADAINRAPTNPIAVSVYGPGTNDLVAERKRLKARFPHKSVRLFDSLSHPLGATGLEA